jgi:hypothetical protein
MIRYATIRGSKLSSPSFPNTLRSELTEPVVLSVPRRCLSGTWARLLARQSSRSMLSVAGALGHRS